MRSSVVAVAPRCAHSVYHDNNITYYRFLCNRPIGAGPVGYQPLLIEVKKSVTFLQVIKEECYPPIAQSGRALAS